MKALALIPFLLTLAACEPKAPDKVASAEAVAQESEQPPESAKTATERDLNRICNAEELSGALDLPTGDRALHTGIWLANNIETQAMREFIAELTKLEAEERIARLQARLAEYKSTECEIVHAWGGS